MSKVAQMLRFKNYGESILKKLNDYDSLLQNESLQEDNILSDLRKQVEIVREQAGKVVKDTSEPVKIAVMGEFKATKTTILGSLLGYAGVLPDSEVAATGNVTHLSVVQVKGSQPTQFQFRVEYFNQSDMREYLDFMFKELSIKARGSQLTEAQIATLNNFSSQDPNVHQKIIQWHEEVIKFKEVGGLEKAIQELRVFAESYQRFGKAVCGRSFPIDVNSARTGLQLPTEPLSIFKLKFPQNKVSKEQLPKFLQATFPLIRRINVEVKVSDTIWDLSSIQSANKLVLLDFPGLGASKSELRDQFLTVHEMKSVQTILLLTYGTRPGSTKDFEIFDLLRKQRQNQNLDDFILVGVGRFDDLPNAETYIDRLLSSNEEITEQKIIDAMPALKAAINNAREFTKGNDERIVLLSAFASLAYGLRNIDSTTRIATPMLLEKLNKFQNDFPALNDKWKQLSEKLKKSQPQSILNTWLNSFTKDGGLTRLRYLLETHVITHGLEQLHRDVSVKVNTLDEEIKILQQKLANPSLNSLLVSENPNLRILRQSLQELADSYNYLKNYLERNVLELGVGINETRYRLSLREKVEEKVNSEISRWSQWRILLSAVKNGFINQKTKKSILGVGKGLSPVDVSILKNKGSIFEKSDDFNPLFEGSFNNLDKFTREEIKCSIQDLLQQLSTEVISLNGNQTIINLKKISDNIKKCTEDDPEFKRVIDTLLLISSPSQWEEAILNEIQIPDKPEILFPLPLKDENRDEPALMFDWSPGKEYNEKIPVPENHLITILRLRDAMITSVRDSFNQTLSITSHSLNETLKDILAENILALEDTLENRNLLKQLVGEKTIEKTTPNWLIALQDVVNIPCPL